MKGCLTFDATTKRQEGVDGLGLGFEAQGLGSRVQGYLSSNRAKGGADIGVKGCMMLDVPRS